MLGVAPLGLLDTRLITAAGAVTTLAHNHCFFATGPGGGLLALRRHRPEDVDRGARRRDGVVDHADLRHPLAVLLIVV